MPEGPEIRRAADRIAEAIEGQTVEELFFAFEALKPWQSRLQGTRVRRVEPRGKALLIRFEDGPTMYSHNQLYGRWFIRERGVLPTTRRQLRAAIHTPRSSALLYSASQIEILDEDGLAMHPYLRKLGLDLLAAGATPSRVRARMLEPRFGRRMLGGLLLDQGFLGGVGNYLRSEILHYAAIDPARRPLDLDEAERRRFARAALTITRRAYRTRGVTREPGYAERQRRRGRPRREYRHYVFGRAGQECPRCDDIIVRRAVAGRRLYACPGCQR
ncbi:MAG: endonuclease VIII [Candidatus Limnocylindrales bacterium]